MRLRIETLPPLPPLKAWLTVSPGLFNLLGTRTISDLRKRIVRDFDLPDEICLELDGFELFGRDSISNLLEKDDLIHVVLRERVGLGKRKRDLDDGEEGGRGVEESKKRQVGLEEGKQQSGKEGSRDEEGDDESSRNQNSSEESSSSSSGEDEDTSSDESSSCEDDEVAASKTPKQTKTNTKISDTSSSPSPSSSSSSSSSSDSDSDSDSGSDSDSSTSSTSSDSSAALLPKKSTPNLSQPPKPPGLGSSRTHLRNLRKTRTKRLKQLIQERILPAGSTLATLAAWEEYPQVYTETSSPVSKAHLSLEQVDLVSQGDYDPRTVNDETPPATTSAKRIDVAAVSRFINASLAGNKLYDKDREEARVRGKEKVGGGRISVSGGISAFVPRAVKAKTATTTTTTTMRSWEGREMEGSAMEEIEDGVGRDEDEERDVMDDVEEQGMMHEQMQDEEQDPLISGFYKQIDLATENRKSKSLSNATTTTTTTDEKPRIQGNLIIRAFECEPGWCGKIKPEETHPQQIDSLEIDPPALPFIDSYYKKQKKIAAKQKRLSNSPGRIKPPISVVGLSSAADAVPSDILELSEEQVSHMSEEQILELRKMETPVRGAGIFFKSMFLDPVRHEPVVAWRWGRISGVDGSDVVIHILGPKFHNEDDGDIEEGEVEEEEEGESLEERVGWGELVDVRCWVE